MPRAEPLDRAIPDCPRCGRALILWQPDEQDPGRVLGHCPGCHGRYRVRWRAESAAWGIVPPGPSGRSAAG